MIRSDEAVLKRCNKKKPPRLTSINELEGFLITARIVRERLSS
jgi:hypothetical protein